MSESKTTQRKWIMSVVAILLCIALLVGLTFAWFTDSASSGNNTIKSGNLDIELYYLDSDGNYRNVESDTELFTDVSLWEPGAVATETFKIANVGNLALQYQLGMGSVVYNTVGDDYSLLDVIKVYVVSGTLGSDTTRSGLIEAYAGSFKSLSEYLEDDSYLKTGYLIPSDDAANDSNYSDSAVYTVILYWEPTDSDNTYDLNNGTTADDGLSYLYLNAGISLYATQWTYESDSYGIDYDAGAEISALPTASVTTLSTSDNISVWSSALTSIESQTAAALFSFSTTESSSEAATSDYASWNADFVVSFDNSVSSVTLIGKYDGWNSSYDDYYVPITLSGVSANSETRLLKNKLGSVLGSSSSVYITYSELCSNVTTFYCGVLDDYSVSSDTVMTVSLVLYETENNKETGNSVTIATYTYTLTAGSEE